MRIIGLDVGEKRVGVAVSDPLGKTAQPYETIEMDAGVFDRLRDLISELDAEELVIGLPLLLNGSEGDQALTVRAFAEEAREKLGIRVALQDERLTTRQAESVLSAGGLGSRERRSASDRVAAALILRSYLDGRAGE